MNAPTVYRMRMNKDQLVKHLRKDHNWPLEQPRWTTAQQLNADHRAEHMALGPTPRTRLGHEHAR